MKLESLQEGRVPWLLRTLAKGLVPVGGQPWQHSLASVTCHKETFTSEVIQRRWLNRFYNIFNVKKSLLVDMVSTYELGITLHTLENYNSLFFL